MKISIVVPQYGSSALLKQCLDSIVNVEPDTSRYEIIVVEDGSPEEAVMETRKVCANSLANTHCIEHSHSRYFSQAVNTGIAHSDGDIVLLMNNDIVCVKPFIDELLKAFDRDKQIGIVGALLCYPDGSTIQHAGISLTTWWGNVGRLEKLKMASPFLRSTYHFGVTGAFMAISRATIEDVGLFNPEYIGAYEDIEYCLRAWDKGYRVFMSSDIQAVHIEGATRGVVQPDKERVSPYLWYMELITARILEKKSREPGYISSIQEKINIARKLIL